MAVKVTAGECSKSVGFEPVAFTGTDKLAAR